MAFENRREAARLLAQRLRAYRGRAPLILAIPRGALPMGEVLADALEGDLDVVLVKKLRASAEPELAIGAVGEDGRVYVSPQAYLLQEDESYIRREAEVQLAALRQRRAQLTPIRPPISPAGRVVIVVDDGLATGATMMAALSVLRPAAPSRLVVAVAVAPPETLRQLEALADEVVCLEAPEDFMSVGAYFDDFAQVSDEEVAEILRRHPARRKSA